MIDAMQVFVRDFESRVRGKAIDSYLRENGFSVELSVDGESDNVGGLIETNVVYEDNLTETDPEAILVELRQRTGFDGIWIQTRRFSMVDEGEYGREQDDELEVDDDEDGAAPAKLPWLIRANGDHEFPRPQNDRTWTLKELKSIVRGSVDMLPVPSASGLEKCLMVVNDNGQLKGLPPNSTASLLMRMNLVGDVLVCPDEMIP